jgi:23S rRNA maturation-related 3'-5' exoribonuclease YhaM
MISDKTLREKVIEAWSYSLCCSDFTRITEIPPDGNPGSPTLISGTQADHLRGVLRLALKMADEFEASWPGVKIYRDVLIAAAACHDVGKPYEFDPTNRKRWAENPSYSGQPTFRHSVFGMHVSLTVGLPEEIAHVAVGHSFEGQYMGLSTECFIVRQADHSWWQLAATLGLVVEDSMKSMPTMVRVRHQR